MSLSNHGEGGYSDVVRKFGRISGLAIGATGIVWDGGNGYNGWLNDITEDTEEDLEVFSSSSLDVYVDGLGGHAGAELAQITTQGKDGIEQTNVVPLNGITPVRFSTHHSGFKFQVGYTAQTYGGPKNPTDNLQGNQGTITFRSVTSQRIIAIIKPHLGRTQMMIWRCPKDHYGEFHKIDLYPVSGKPVTLKLLARSARTLWSWLAVGQIDTSGDGTIHITHPFPDYIRPGTDLCVVATATVATADCSAQMWIKKIKIDRYEELLAAENE